MGSLFVQRKPVEAGKWLERARTRVGVESLARKQHASSALVCLRCWVFGTARSNPGAQAVSREIHEDATDRQLDRIASVVQLR